MSFQKIVIVGILGLMMGNAWAQDSLKTVIAQKGDGIYSMLRKQGIDPVRYYEDFIALNESNLKSGSRLHEGREYIIPHVTGSFKEMGVKVQLPQGLETPIFDKEVESFVRKDSSLHNVVYYLISTGTTRGKATRNTGESPLENDIATWLAKELLQHGAQVYLLQDFRFLSASGSEGENREEFIAETKVLDTYIDVVNKRYLKHSGKYQRLLIIQENDGISKSGLDVTIYHHDSSLKGKKLANNIQRMFQDRSVKQKYIKNSAGVFTDQKDLYLAKNTLPTMTYIEIGQNPKSDGGTFKARSNKKNLTDLITNGILMDYSKLDFEDND